jgi:amino acid transporter
MAAEEAKDPQRSVPVAYIAGILTLVLLALGVMILPAARATGPSWPTSTIRCRRP